MSRNYHTNDPASSREAADLVAATGTQERHARRVLELVRANPDLTAVELMAAQAGPGALDEYPIRRRLSDLLKDGAVEQGAPRPCRVRGTKMVTWRLTRPRRPA